MAKKAKPTTNNLIMRSIFLFSAVVLLAVGNAFAAVVSSGEEPPPTTDPLARLVGQAQGRSSQREELLNELEQAIQQALDEKLTIADKIRLPVENVLQLPELRNGCEATSLAMALDYLGYDADKVDLAYRYIPREDFVLNEQEDVWYGCEPEQAYPGDPAATMGFYTYPSVVIEGANAFLKEQASEYTAYDASGFTEDDFIKTLNLGTPVLVWSTTDGEEPYQSEAFQWIVAETGETYTPYMNLHVAVLTGYDEENFYVCDPLGLRESLGREEFMSIYLAAGGYAVAFKK